MFSEIAAAAIATAGTASWLGYNCYKPTSQLYGRTLAYLPDAKQIALTYDDGPNDPWTGRLLDVLARADVKATFFLIGKWARQRPDLVRDIAAAGHTIGNHTEHHPNLLYLAPQKIRDEFMTCSAALSDVLGYAPKAVRPPFGARRPAVLRVARELGLEPIMWSVTCFDWMNTTADRVEEHAVKGIESRRDRGHILLMHDGFDQHFGADRSHTVEATRRVIERYKPAGYSFTKIGS